MKNTPTTIHNRFRAMTDNLVKRTNPSPIVIGIAISNKFSRADRGLSRLHIRTQEEAAAAAKSEIRISKSEPNPNFEEKENKRAGHPCRLFGFRIWSFFRISRFGFRICRFGAVQLRFR